MPYRDVRPSPRRARRAPAVAPRRRMAAALTVVVAAATAVVVAPSTAAAAGALPTVTVRSVTAPLTNLTSHTGVTRSATCPAGTLVGGGGYLRNATNPTTLPTNGLVLGGTAPSTGASPVDQPSAGGDQNPGSWLDYANFTGQSEAGNQATGFALCATGGPTHTVVATNSTVGANAAQQASAPNLTIATCPVGTTLVGGGAVTSTPDQVQDGTSIGNNGNLKPMGDYPSDAAGVPAANGSTSATSWSAFGSAGGVSATDKVTAFALCTSDPIGGVTVARVDVSGPNAQPGTTITPGTALCPAGTQLLGGGYRTDETVGGVPGLQPQQGYHMRGSYPSTTSGTPPVEVDDGTVNPSAWSALLQAGGQGLAANASMQLHTFALCALPTTPAPAATTTQLTVTPASPAPSGDQETLTATVSPGAPGTVQFADGGAPLGDPVPTAGGVASTEATLASGTHSLTAVFTPDDPAAFAGSTSDPVSYTVNQPPVQTHTQLDITPDSPAASGTQETLTATVSPTAPGSVQFLDDGTPVGDPVRTAGGVASTDATLASGTHSLTAVFTPDDPAAFAGSTSDPVSYTVNQPPVQTHTQLDITPDSPAPAGTQETITVTVSPAAAGTVQLNDGGIQVGRPVPVTDGTATVVTTLEPGRHDVSAVFAPADPGAFTGSFSNSVPYLVNRPIATSTQLDVTPAGPVPADSRETLTATVSPAVSGTVQFSDGTTALGDPVTVTDGTASTTATLAPGSHALSAVFTPADPVAYTGSTSNTVAYTVKAPPVQTHTQLRVNPTSPAPAGARETLTATVSPTAAGTVRFRDGNLLVGDPVAVDNGSASTTVTLSPGDHLLSADFTPADPDAFTDSVAYVTYTVNPRIATTTLLDVAPGGPVQAGTQETLTATVGPAVAGTVRFRDAGVDLGNPVPTNGGSASTTVTLTPGSHSLTATFTPTDLAAYTVSTSNTVSYTVNAPITTTTGLGVTPAGPAPAGTRETLTATVSPAAAGTVRFSDGTTALGGPVTVTNGTASTTATLAPGTHSLSATFTPANPGAYTGSTSNTVSYTVKPPAVTTTTQLSVTPASPAPSGTQETLTAKVSPTAAAGTVQFRDGSTPVGGPVTVTNGTASTRTTLGQGTHSLTATFTPANPGAYTGSTSTTVSYTVNPPPRADIGVGVRATPTSGRAFTVTVTTTNHGPNTAQEVLTTVTLPNGLRATSAPGGFISGDGRTVFYRTASLAASRSVTSTVKVTAGPPARGNQTIGARAGSFTQDPVTSNNTATTTVRVT